MSANAVPQKKPLRFKIGITLLALCALIYVAIVVALFLPMAGGSKVSVVGGMVVAAELCMIGGAAGVGKEAVQVFKARLGRKEYRRTGRRDPAAK
ncbi:transporter suffix domain-containing protein [Streptomyces kronopolitis]